MKTFFKFAFLVAMACILDAALTASAGAFAGIAGIYTIYAIAAEV